MVAKVEKGGFCRHSKYKSIELGDQLPVGKGENSQEKMTNVST